MIGAQTGTALSQDAGEAWQAVSDGAAQVTDDAARAAGQAIEAVREPIAEGWAAVIKDKPRLVQGPTPLRVPKPQAVTRSEPRAPTRTGSDAGGRPKHAMAGIASYYWQGHTTASGEAFDKRDMTAAHPTLPFGTRVRVHCKESGRDVVVRINDRGPFKPGRVIDLSEAAAEVIGMQGRGLTSVQLTVLAESRAAR